MRNSSAHRLTAFFCGVLAMVIVDVVNAEMCKWVDEDGCIHYAEQCPDDVEGQPVEIHPGPSEEAVKQAEKRIEQQQKSIYQHRQADREATEKRSAERAAQSTAGINASLCTQAWHTIAKLESQWPVYADSEGRYHLKNTLHSWYYEGKRTWLEDDMRQAELHLSGKYIEQNCDSITATDHPDLITRKFAPRLLETIRVLEEAHFEDFAKISRELYSGWCAYGKRMLGAVEDTRAPGGEVRRLEELLEEKCN